MNQASGIAVEVVRSIEAVDPGEWRRTVARADAPVFYSYEYLAAYERHPLGAFAGGRYLLVRSRGELIAVFPCYLQPRGDPLGVFANSPVTATNPAVLGHVWYCYDTRIPHVATSSGLVTAICEAVLDELARVRIADHAALAGFVNVAEGDPLLEIAQRKGWLVIPMDIRYQLLLDGMATFDDYLASLARKPRQNLGRHLRRARDAGVTTSVSLPRSEDLPEVGGLCRLTAGKFGNTDFYPQDQFGGFVMGLADRARVVRVDRGGELLATAVALLDESRLHMWVAGFRYATVAGFSPHYVLWSAEIRAAIELRASLVEGGRRNDLFKKRHGMRPVQLHACVTAG